MVAKVWNEGECPVRVLCPLNVGGTLGFGSIEGFEVNVLWLRVTFPWHDDVGGSQEGSFSCPWKAHSTQKISPNAASCSTKLRHEVEARVGEFWNRPHEVDSKGPNLLPQLQPQLQKISQLGSWRIEVEVINYQSWGSSCALSWPQVCHVWNTLLFFS